MPNNNSIFDFANQSGIDSPLGNWLGDDKEEYLYNLRLDTKKLIDFIKKEVDRHIKDGSVHAKDFLLPKPLNRGLIAPLPPVIEEFEEYIDRAFQRFLPQKKYKYDVIFKRDPQDPIIINTEMGIVLNNRIAPVDFTNPSINIDFRPEDKECLYTIAFHFVDRELTGKFAVKLIFEKFENLLAVIKFFNEKWLIDSYSYARFINKYTTELDKAAGKPGVLAWLYFAAPNILLYRRSEQKLIADLITIVEKGGNVDEIGVNEEIAVLKILQAFSEPGPFDRIATPELEEVVIKAKTKSPSGNKPRERYELLLDALATVRDGTTLFEELYHALDDTWGKDNFTAFIILTYKYWLLSTYSSDDKKIKYNNHPEIFNYDSDKLLGFYFSSYSFRFSQDQIIVYIKEKDKTVKLKDILIGPPVAMPVYEYFATYHIFQPLTLSTSKVKGEIKIPSRLVPAFYLKAFEQKNAVANLEKTLWIVADIALTFTAVGNLLKLRHLSHLSTLAKTIRIGIAGIEVASTTLNLMLQFVNDCDDGTFCEKLRTYLFWVDLATVSIDALTQKLVRKSAAEAAEELRKIPNALDEKTEEILKHLDDVANDVRRTVKSVDDLIEEYGQLVIRGDRRYKTAFEKELEKILKETETTKFVNEAKARFKRRGRKITEAEYIEKHKQRIVNITKGSRAETLFAQFFQGAKPSKSIKTSIKNRFIDNIYNDTAREIKSGFIKNTEAFQKQFKKDIEIAFLEKGGITKIEWHLLNGISDDAIAFMKEYAKEQKVLDKVKIIIH